ncbi:MAG: hypothetical protein HKO80_08485 [Flavobacteriaceae bacterium]|nr:hypothetical protein [Flavobacteriaceae bacterium]NNL33226.1 hypothetical protein [Flavobacteriaceae bacterium]
MRKLLFLSILCLSLSHCAKDDAPNEIDYSEFFADDNVRIAGEFNGQALSWVYGEDYGKNFGGCIYTETNIVYNKSGMREINNEIPSEDRNQFRIITPEYDIDDESQNASVFATSQKGMGALYEGFRFTMTINGIEYESCDNPTEYELEVLKRSENQPWGEDHIFQVWFRIGNLMLNECGNETNVAELKNVFFVVDFTWPIL